jgi:hypothetical protein
MKLRHSRLAAVLLAGAVAATALVPAAQAGSRGRHREHRTYFYYDPYCGRTHEHISAFKHHYDRARHGGLIHKVDKWSRDVIKSYAWDGRRWRDAPTRRLRDRDRGYHYGSHGGYARDERYEREYERERWERSERGW